MHGFGDARREGDPAVEEADRAAVLRRHRDRQDLPQGRAGGGHAALRADDPPRLGEFGGEPRIDLAQGRPALQAV
ncbi:hypothetical protein GCM10025881_23550 [Pseudolysinimonas kribbensis]|uniref:Uncharacterized protein n=1 Tax=Pseudolysinimonas kribbensis TaxID=433641 RepID=A0ABQ6K4H9_9MICO|nr:hypothetical protein GCM10025881_23550 [Pseudolysinimonas kribbensis]